MTTPLWMTHDEFQGIRKRLDSPRDSEKSLTQLELADLLDLDPMTISRYERGTVAIPKAVAVVMVLLDRGHLTVQQLDTRQVLRVSRLLR